MEADLKRAELKSLARQQSRSANPVWFRQFNFSAISKFRATRNDVVHSRREGGLSGYIQTELADFFNVPHTAQPLRCLTFAPTAFRICRTIYRFLPQWR